MGNAARDEDAERMERLIASNEANANALQRLVQVLENKRQRRTANAQKQRRVVVDKPITVTPLVEAAARRALARVRSR